MNTTYVKIEEATLLRKEVLKNALDTMSVLKSYERYKTLRRVKLRKITELKAKMQEVEEHFLVLHERYLPALEREVSVGRKEFVSKKSSSKIVQPRNDLDKLNFELQELERKLREL